MADVTDIVIISYNGLLVDQAARSIEAHTTAGTYRIIVQVAKASIPENVNAGFAKVTSDWFVLFNDDWEATEDGWLARLKSFTRDDVGFVSCRFVFQTGMMNHRGYTISPNGFPTNLGRNEPNHVLPDEEIEYAHPCLISSKAFKKIGHYDTRFKGSQYADIDFVYRTKRAGYKIFFAGSVWIRHHYGENKATNGVRERMRMVNAALFRAKHGFSKKTMISKMFPRRLYAG